MDTTTFVLEQLDADDRAESVRRLLDDEPGVARVLVRPDRAEIYVRHSAAKAPRNRLLERLRDEGYVARIKRR
ncbi:MAG: hypothetical protein ACODAE_01425 [Gemmatimonadota bacterium]